MIEGERWQSGITELGELRVRLDQMTGRITSRLKDRSRFPLNDAVYVPDGVPIKNRSGISLLEFAIEGLESYHSSLGRFEDPDQYPVLGTNLPASSVQRKPREVPIPHLKIDSTHNLLPFYRQLVTKHCEPRDNPDSYGETAYIDADLTQMMHERVNIGRYVAEVKANQDPSLLELTSNTELLITKLTDKTREEALITKVRETAQHYELDPDMAEEAFRWMIEQTVDIEVAYVQQIANMPNNE